MSELNLGTLTLPVQAATKTFAILAKRGAGKSYTAAVLAEEFYEHKIPFVVFDPIDIWWGLRFGADGILPGLPIVVFGLEHADIRLTKDMGVEIARAIVDTNISCVISTFGMPKSDQKKLILDLSTELLRINKSPRHIFIEEAHEFVPQRVLGDMGKVFNAVSNLIVMGRNRGLGVTLINQRAATINKDVLTQIDTLLAFRNVAPQDRKALKEWVEYHAAEGDFNEFMDSLPSLPTGEGWVWSPEFLNKFERVKIRTRRTLHPDRETLGELTLPELNSVDVQGFINNFNSQASYGAIDLDFSDLKVKAPKIAKQESRASYEATANIIKENLRNEIRQEFISELQKKDSEIKALTDVIKTINSALGTLTEELKSITGINIENQTTIVADERPIDMWLTKVSGGAQRILKFLSEKSGMKFTKSQIALSIGMTAKGGAFNSYISILKQNNLIIVDNGLYYVNPEIL